MSYPFLTLKNTPQGIVVHGQAHARLGYAAYAPTGEDEPYSMHGWWKWDGQTLTAGVDRFGMFNLYYHATDDTLMISPSPLQLIAEGAPATPDPQALTLLYRIGMCVGNDTPFAHIKVLPWGGALRWQPGACKVDSHRPTFRERKMTRREAVEGFIELFRASVRKCVERCPHPLVLTLSGGRDSRHILLAMEHLGALPQQVVTVNGFNNTHDAEVLAARGVTELMGIEHTILNVAPSPPWNRLRSLVAGHLCTDEHLQFMPIADYLRDQPCVIMDGLAGDTLSRSGLMDPDRLAVFTSGQYFKFAGLMMTRHASIVGGRLEEWLGPDATTDYPFEQAQAYLAEHMAGFEEEAEPLHAFAFWHRMRREITLSGTAIFGQTAGTLCPFLDPPLVEFMMSVPYDITSDATLQDEAIATAYPRYAHLPYYDQLPKGKSRRLPLHTRARALVEIVRKVGQLDPKLRRPELAAQLGLLRKPHLRKLDAYRLHQLCMRQITHDPAKAAQLIKMVGAGQGLSQPLPMPDTTEAPLATAGYH